MEHAINACGHANSSVHENMQSLIEQSGSVRKYAKDEIIYLQGDTAQSFCYIKKGSVKVYMNSVDGNEKTLNTARHGEIIGEKEVKIDQCVIGSCTNGRISDLRAAANILKGKKIAKNVRCIIFPGTQQIWLDAMHEGLFDIFIEAGAVVSTPTCGPCLGGHMGILAAGERAISTTNRNFVGRMGHVDSEVYLASPAVAAASAVAGYIIDPEKV
jgi:homoaconitase/3-isopropylmalate dehydratase large subunit